LADGETGTAFTGHVDDDRVREYLKSSKVLALPSVREGFGMVAIEAQAAGCVPVVVRSEHSAASDLIRDGVDGVACEPTAEAMSETLLELLKDSRRLPRMGKAAASAAKRWDWGNLAGDLEANYVKVAQASPNVQWSAFEWR
jgi:L-malate glycosyltransferase